MSGRARPPHPRRDVACGRSAARSRDEGVALATAVAIVTVVFMMLAAVVLPVATDVSTSVRARRVTEARSLADSVLNEIFAEIAGDPAADAQLAGRVSPGVQVSDAGPTGGWAAWDTNTNGAVPCPSVRATCFYYAVSPPALLDASATATPADDYAVAEVTVRTGCTAPGERCVVRRVQQRLKRRRLLDYALFTDFETLEPGLYATEADRLWAATACSRRADGNYLASPPRQQPDGTPSRAGDCADVVFIGFGTGTTNLVRGPIHTNDPQFWVCGAPEFTGRVEATGDQPLVAFPRGGCLDRAVAPSVVTAPTLPMPTSVTRFADVTPPGYRLTGPVAIELDGPTMLVRDATGSLDTMPVPERGLVYVDGPLTLHGVAEDATFVSTASVTIDGDLRSADGGEGSDVGIVAHDDIVFDVPGDLTVHASLLASNGTVYNSRFREPVTAAAPVVTIRGSVIARFHPVSGLFEPSTGALVSGAVSDLAYSDPAPNPPYFLEPVQALWERVDYTEVRLEDDALSEGLTPRPLAGLPAPVASCGADPTAVPGPYLRACLHAS